MVGAFVGGPVLGVGAVAVAGLLAVQGSGGRLHSPWSAGPCWRPCSTASDSLGSLPITRLPRTGRNWRRGQETRTDRVTACWLIVGAGFSVLGVSGPVGTTVLAIVLAGQGLGWPAVLVAVGGSGGGVLLLRIGLGALGYVDDRRRGWARAC